MTTVWRLIDSGPCAAAYNMALDEAIAASVRLRGSRPTLRFYGWQQTAVTIGCFQSSAGIDLQYCESHGIAVVRRPTGGRAVLHADELTYSLSLPYTAAPFAKSLRESYEAVGSAFSAAFRKLGICAEARSGRENRERRARNPLCFESASFAEIVLDGSKVVGSAQRRWREGLLQQGSIPFSPAGAEMQGVFGIGREGFSLPGLSDLVPAVTAPALKRAITAAFQEAFGVALAPSAALPEEEALARELLETKYLRRSWNFRK